MGKLFWLNEGAAHLVVLACSPVLPIFRFSSLWTYVPYNSLGALLGRMHIRMGYVEACHAPLLGVLLHIRHTSVRGDSTPLCTLFAAVTLGNLVSFVPFFNPSLVFLI